MDLRFSKIVSLEYKTIEMMLYGVIGEEINGSYFAQELAYLAKNYNEIIIRVNSEGGSVSDGLGILAIMMSSAARIVVQVDGIAASMAAITVAGADEVRMNDFAQLMIHSPYYLDENDERITTLSAKEKIALGNLTASLVQLLTKRGIEEKVVREMMNGDTWFDAESALKAKLIDKIITTGRKVELAALEPKRLVAALMQEHTNTQDTNMKKVIAHLKLPENATEEQVIAAIEKIPASPNPNTVILVDKLIAVGKQLGTITEANEPSMRKLADKDMQLFCDLFPVDVKEAGDQPGVGAKGEQVRLSQVLGQIQATLGANNPAAKSDKDRYAEVEKKGTQAIAAWRQEKPEEFKKCFKAFWGEDPK